MRHLIYMFFAAAAITVAVPFASAVQTAAPEQPTEQTQWQPAGQTATPQPEQAAPEQPSPQPEQEHLTPGEARRRARLFDEHTIRMGETAFSIARGYAISPVTLSEDNPTIDLTQIRPGQLLLIRKRERGRTNPAEVTLQWQQILAATDALRADETTDLTTAAEISPDSLWLSTGGRDLPTPDFEASRGTVLDGGVDFSTAPNAPSTPAQNPATTPTSTIPRIALLLPLSGTSANPAGNDFTDFYKGALLALENLKASGRSAVVSVYDSGRSATKTEQIVTSAEFIETDLIIGPVYEEEMEPALRFGEFFGVPVVSPLATIRNLDSPVLYQMAPAAESKYDKLLPLLEGDANIILVSSGTNDDPVFESEITTLLADRPYSRFTIGGSREGIASVIDWERENILVVLAGSEGSVDQALATISSSYSNASARRSRRADIRVVGSSRWASYGASIDRNLFFKLGVTFVANYHIDHSDPETRLFESRYLELYGGLPSRSAFRGYDAVALFAGALFEGGHSLHERGSSSFSDRLSFGDRQPDSRLSFDSKLERVGTTPLGAPYRFTRPYGTQKQINNQWTLVTFSSDYNVTTR